MKTFKEAERLKVRLKAKPTEMHLETLSKSKIRKNSGSTVSKKKKRNRRKLISY